MEAAKQWRMPEYKQRNFNVAQIVYVTLICEDCGAVVEPESRAAHERFHLRLDRIEQDAFQGGGLIG